MDATAFVEWTWTLSDDQKRALARRVVAARGTTDDRYLGEARMAAEAATTDALGLEEQWASVSVSPSPDDFPDADLPKWNREVGDHLRSAYRDTLLAIILGDAIGKGHRRVLAWPLLPQVQGLSEALGLA